MDSTAQLSAGWLLAICGLAIAVLLFLIIRVRLHAILSLILVSAATALATGTPIGKVVETLLDGLGSTLGEVGLLIGLGAILGRLVEVSGGAAVLAEGLERRFGERRAPLALSVAALLFGFPIFLDAAFVVLLPIIFSVALRLGGSLLLYALPVTGALAVMHSLLPPHPGPVAGANLIGADLGLVVLMGLVVGLPTWYVAGHRLGLWLGRRYDLPVPSLLGSAGNNNGTNGNGTNNDDDRLGPPPSMGVLILLLVLPVLLIFCNTGVSTLVEAGTVSDKAVWAQALLAIGETPSALLITVLAAMWLLGWRRRHGGAVLERIIDKALAPVCTILLLTGAGGMFGSVLESSGIGDAVAGAFADLGLPLIVAAFLTSLLIRIAQGSATVALTTAAALIAPAVKDADPSGVATALIVIAMGAAAIMFSHVNDSGFWLVRGFLGMDTKTTLKTWTLQGTAIGLMAFLLSCLVYVFA